MIKLLPHIVAWVTCIELVSLDSTQLAVSECFSGAVGQCGAIFEQVWVLSKQFPLGPRLFPQYNELFPTNRQ